MLDSLNGKSLADHPYMIFPDKNTQIVEIASMMCRVGRLFLRFLDGFDNRDEIDKKWPLETSQVTFHAVETLEYLSHAIKGNEHDVYEESAKKFVSEIINDCSELYDAFVEFEKLHDSLDARYKKKCKDARIDHEEIIFEFNDEAEELVESLENRVVDFYHDFTKREFSLNEMNKFFDDIKLLDIANFLKRFSNRKTEPLLNSKRVMEILCPVKILEPIHEKELIKMIQSRIKILEVLKTSESRVQIKRDTRPLKETLRTRQPVVRLPKTIQRPAAAVSVPLSLPLMVEIKPKPYPFLNSYYWIFMDTLCKMNKLNDLNPDEIMNPNSQIQFEYLKAIKAIEFIDRSHYIKTLDFLYYFDAAYQILDFISEMNRVGSRERKQYILTKAYEKSECVFALYRANSIVTKVKKEIKSYAPRPTEEELHLFCATIPQKSFLKEIEIQVMRENNVKVSSEFTSIASDRLDDQSLFDCEISPLTLQAITNGRPEYLQQLQFKVFRESKVLPQPILQLLPSDSDDE